MKDDTVKLIIPDQLRYGVRLGAEAAAHAARLYLSKLTANKVLLKLISQMLSTLYGGIKCLHQLNS